MKGKATYNVYTGVNLTSQQWIAMNLIIIEPSYTKHSMVCHGSHIRSTTEIKFTKSPVKLDAAPGLPYLMGLEAIYN